MDDTEDTEKLTTERHGISQIYILEWILSFITTVDRINRIYMKSFARFPDENGQTLSPSAN